MRKGQPTYLHFLLWTQRKAWDLFSLIGCQCPPNPPKPMELWLLPAPINPFLSKTTEEQNHVCPLDETRSSVPALAEWTHISACLSLLQLAQLFLHMIQERSVSITLPSVPLRAEKWRYIRATKQSRSGCHENDLWQVHQRTHSQTCFRLESEHNTLKCLETFMFSQFMCFANVHIDLPLFSTVMFTTRNLSSPTQVP